MIETIIRLAWLLLALLPFLLLALLNKKANLKRAVRDRQFPMPVVTLVYCVLLIIFLGWISQWILTLMELLAGFLTSAGTELTQAMDGALSWLGEFLQNMGAALSHLLETVDPAYKIGRASCRERV